MPNGDDLKKGLTQDIARGEAITQRSAAGRGQRPSQSPTGFLPSALRIQGKVVAKEELAKVKSAIDRTTERLMDIHGLKGAEERRSAKFKLTKQMNALTLELTKKAGQFRLDQVKRGLNASQQSRGNQALMGLFSGATSSLISMIPMKAGPKDLGETIAETEGTTFEQSELGDIFKA